MRSAPRQGVCKIVFIMRIEDFCQSDKIVAATDNGLLAPELAAGIARVKRQP